MRIGELAKKAGVNIQSIRFYERQGIMRKPPRTAAGYRDYQQCDLERIVFIKWCQPLGFTLKEVKQLAQLHAAVMNISAPRRTPSPRELQRIIHMAQVKLADLQKKITLLKSASRELSLAIESLQGPPEPVCPASSSLRGWKNSKDKGMTKGGQKRNRTSGA